MAGDSCNLCGDETVAQDRDHHCQTCGSTDELRALATRWDDIGPHVDRTGLALLLVAPRACERYRLIKHAQTWSCGFGSHRLDDLTVDRRELDTIADGSFAA